MADKDIEEVKGFLGWFHEHFLAGRGEQLQTPSPVVVASALRANANLSAADKKRLAEEVLPSVNRSARLFLSLYGVPDSQHKVIADSLMRKTRLTTMAEFEKGSVGTASPDHIAVNYWEMKKSAAPHPVVLHEVISHSPEVAGFSNHPELTGNAIDHYYELVHAGRAGKNTNEETFLDRVNYVASHIYEKQEEEEQREAFKRTVISLAVQRKHGELRSFLKKVQVELSGSSYRHYLGDYDVDETVSNAKKLFDNRWHRAYLKKTELQNFEAIERLYAGHPTNMTEHPAPLDWNRPAIDSVARTLSGYAYNLERASGIPGAGLFFIRDVSLGVSVDDAFKNTFSPERQTEIEQWFAKGHDPLSTYDRRFRFTIGVPNPVKEREKVKGTRTPKFEPREK